MMKVSLTELLTRLAENRRQSSRILLDWPEHKVKQLTPAFTEMMTSAGVKPDEAQEIAEALESWLLGINEAADTIARTSGAAEHVIEKGRAAIRKAAAASSSTGFRID